MAKKILLIEYEPRYLDRIRGHLAGKDFDLVVAKDGEEGLDAYKKARPDLVLISSVLPKLRTPDVIKGMQGLGPTPPILLMMSGYKGKNKKSDAQRVGASSILEKPFSEEVFLSEITGALGAAKGDGSGSSAVLAAPDPNAPLLSADDIFSDVLSGMEEEPRPAPAPIPGGTDPGIQKKLEQTLSGILPSPKKTLGSSASIPIPKEVKQAAKPPEKAPEPAPAPPPPAPKAPEPVSTSAPTVIERIDKLPTGSSTVRIDALQVPPAPPPSQRSGERAAVNASVDKMLTDTLSGLKSARAEKAAPKPAAAAPAPATPGTASAPSPAAEAPKPAAPKPAPAPEPKAAPAPAPAPAPEPKPRVEPRAARPEPRPAPPPPPPSVTPAPMPKLETPKKEERRREVTATTASGMPGSFGRYNLLEKIASGGMAEVFKARMRGEEGFEKIVAIKRILPHMADNDDFITMFIDEAKLAAQLTHNNIIHIYDLGKVDQYHYIAMEYVEGKDLRSILKQAQERDYPLPVELALFIASKIANALDYAHRRVGMDGKELNLVHRDVSPQNILISFEGDIKLCDFGIAKAATKVSQTQTGALKGKLQYMSPEQAWGKKIDRRTDIFSLGIVLFEMLTGERLFTGDTDLTILEQVRDAKVVAPSTKNGEVPKRVDQIVLKALAKNPQDRYQNASEFEKEINQVLYSYQPTPGPADLAIFMHRLGEATAAPSDQQIDAAFAAADTGMANMPETKKGKGLVISKKEKVERPAPAPVPRVEAVEPPKPLEVSAPALTIGQETGKSRTGLFVGIGVAAVVLVGAMLLLKKKGPDQAAVQPPPQPPPVTAATAPVEPPPPAGEPTKIIDPKAVAEEARRLATEKLKGEQEAAKQAAKGVPTAAPKAAAAVPPTAAPSLSLAAKQPALPPQAPTQPPPTAPPTAVPTQAPKPTEPVRVAEARPAPAAAYEVPPDAPVKEGDLVGPGEGVVEPSITKMAGVTGIPPSIMQLVRGKAFTPVIMALVTENGTVSDARVQQKTPYKAIDDAAVAALKNSKISPATKHGVRVKYWKAFAITVKP